MKSQLLTLNDSGGSGSSPEKAKCCEASTERDGFQAAWGLNPSPIQFLHVVD